MLTSELSQKEEGKVVWEIEISLWSMDLEEICSLRHGVDGVGALGLVQDRAVAEMLIFLTTTLLT